MFLAIVPYSSVILFI